MLGAIIGDIVGSRFERRNIKSKDFVLLTERCSPTDDSLMTLAVGKAILEADGDYTDFLERVIQNMQELGRAYPHAGYGGNFSKWLHMENPLPYNSYGNGSAMRVSACAWAAKSLEEALALAESQSKVSHNHPEGIKGAKAISAAIFLARIGKSKEEIRAFIHANYYVLEFTLEEIRPFYSFDVSCQGSVPQAIVAFLESTNFEDAIRNAISIGGDSDTIAAMAGSIAEAYYGIPSKIAEIALSYLDERQCKIISDFGKIF